MPVNSYYGGHGSEVMTNMQSEYGSPAKAKQVFYATLNKRKHPKPMAYGGLVDPYDDPNDPRYRDLQQQGPPPPPDPQRMGMDPEQGPPSPMPAEQGPPQPQMAQPGPPVPELDGPPQLFTPPKVGIGPEATPEPEVPRTPFQGAMPPPRVIPPLATPPPAPAPRRTMPFQGAMPPTPAKVPQSAPPPPPQPVTDAYQLQEKAFQNRKEPGKGRQILAGALAATRLRGAAPYVSGEAARTRELENLSASRQAATEEQQNINHAADRALKQKQMELTDQQKQESLDQQALLRKPPQTIQDRVREAQQATDEQGNPLYTPEEVRQIGAGWKPPDESFAAVTPGSPILNKRTGALTPGIGEKPETGDDFKTVFLPSYAKSLGKTVQQLTPEETMKSFGVYKATNADPEMRAATLASKAAAEAVRLLAEGQQPTPEQAGLAADDIIAHRLAPSQLSSIFGGFGTSGQSFKRMVYAEAKKRDKEFNFEQAEAEYALTKSQGFQNTVRYLDSTRNSIPEVLKTAQALANGKIKLVNTAQNIALAQTNNIDLGKFNTARLLVADEIGKILAGGGTGSGTSDAKLNQAMKLIKESDDPALVASNMAEVNLLLGYRRGALTKGTYLEKAEEQHPGAAPQQGIAPPLAGATVVKWGRDASGKPIPLTQAK